MDLEIIKIASNTDNNNILKDYTHIAKHKNPLCGDEITIYLRLNDEKIIKFYYQSKSCIYCQASVSLLSRYATNKSLLNIKFLIFIMGNVPRHSPSFPNIKTLIYC